MIVYLEESMQSAIRRLETAQAADGAREFIGQVTLMFDSSGNASLRAEDPVWVATDERQIDTRLIRDNPYGSIIEIESPGIS